MVHTEKLPLPGESMTDAAVSTVDIPASLIELLRMKIATKGMTDLMLVNGFVNMGDSAEDLASMPLNGKGMNALHLAIVENNVKMVSALLGHGADIEAVTAQGCTPLEIAAVEAGRHGDLQVFAKLLDDGANPQAKNPYTGQSILHNVHVLNNWAVMQVLLELDDAPDLNAVDKNGFNPLDVARAQRCHPRVCEYLERQGATSDKPYSSPEPPDGPGKSRARTPPAPGEFLDGRAAVVARSPSPKIDYRNLPIPRTPGRRSATPCGPAVGSKRAASPLPVSRERVPRESVGRRSPTTPKNERVFIDLTLD